MPNIKSAKKRVKVTQAKALQNKMFRTSFKNIIKKYETAIELGNKAEAEANYAETIRMIDKAVAKGILHSNTAARKKSRYTTKLNKLSA